MSYDSDVATFSPTGKLNQIIYAMEAPNFGSPSVGLASKDAVVLVSVRRQTTPLSSFQDKLFEVDKHIGICISGIYADAYKMLRLLRDECTEYTYVYDAPHPVAPLVAKLAENAQARTQFWGYRPYGASLLIGGIDTRNSKKTPCLYVLSPNAVFKEYRAVSLGMGSQTINTHLKNHIDEYENASIERLIALALDSLGTGVRDCRPSEKNLSIGVLDRTTGGVLRILTKEEILPHIQRFEMDNPLQDIDQDSDNLD